MTLPTTLDLDDLARRITQACEIAGEPVDFIDRSLDNLLDIYGGEGWSLQIGNPRHPPGDPDIVLLARRGTCGRMTAGWWAAIKTVDAFLHQLPNDQRF